MDIKRLGRLFQLRKQANGLGQQVGGGGGSLSATSGYTTGANAANRVAQMPPPPDNMAAIRGIQEREKAYFSNLDRGKLRPPTSKPAASPAVTPGAAAAANTAAPAAPQAQPAEPVSDAQRAMDDLKAGFRQAGKAGPTGPPPPKSPDVIPTNSQTGVPDKYYSLGTPGSTPDWAKPKNPTPAPKVDPGIQAQFDAADAANATAKVPAPAPASTDVTSLFGQGGSKPPIGGDDEDTQATSPLTATPEKRPSAGAADVVNMLQVGTGGPITEHEHTMPGGPPIGMPKQAPQPSARSSAMYTDEHGRQRPVSALTADAEELGAGVAGLGNTVKRTGTFDAGTGAFKAAPAAPERPYAPKEIESPSGGVGYDLSGLQGDKAKAEAFQMFDRPKGGGRPMPVAKAQPAKAAQPPRKQMSQQQANRVIAAMGSVPGEQMIKTQSFMRESQIKAIVQDISIPATCLLVLCLDEWGTDMLDWEPETLEQAARMSWNAELPQANRDKIWALITHMTTDAFYSSLEGFIHICNALSGHGVDFEQFDPAEVDEMCWGVTEAFLIAPMEKEDRFTEEIVTYMETRLEYEGFQKVPHMLKKFVQIPAREEELNQTLTLDGVGFKNYWKMQEGRLANIDIWIKERLAALFALLESLPLRYANEQGLKRICERAKSTLGSQQALKQEVMAASR